MVLYRKDCKIVLYRIIFFTKLLFVLNVIPIEYNVFYIFADEKKLCCLTKYTLSYVLAKYYQKT